MNRGKPNFFIYAISEVILVVIGILIAVSINNWNEKRKQNIELNQILLNVKKDLNTDISKIDKVVYHYESVDSVFQNVLKSKYTERDYKENPQIARLIFGFPEISFTKRGIYLLENFKGNLNSRNEDLVQDLVEFYNVQLWEIKVDDELRAEDLKENFSYWKNGTRWWSDYVQLKINDDFIKYAVESEDYKTRVATAQFYAYKVYLPEITKFKNRATNLVKEIDHRTE